MNSSEKYHIPLIIDDEITHDCKASGVDSYFRDIIYDGESFIFIMKDYKAHKIPEIVLDQLVSKYRGTPVYLRKDHFYFSDIIKIDNYSINKKRIELGLDPLPEYSEYKYDSTSYLERGFPDGDALLEKEYSEGLFFGVSMTIFAVMILGLVAFFIYKIIY